MKKRRERRSVNHFSLTLAAGSVTIGGQTIQGRSVRYARTDFDDGTCDETGLPPGMAPRPSMADLFGYVFGGESPPEGKSDGKGKSTGAGRGRSGRAAAG